jgi:hypothetical protein
MRTTISLPQPLFALIDAARGPLGMTRSAFLTRAATSLLADLDADATTAHIDQALALIGDTQTGMSDAVAVGRALLNEEHDRW